MKPIILLTLGMVLFPTLSLGDSYRTTASDLYIAGYNAQMRQHYEMSATEARAQSYHERSEICDIHHNCYVPTESKKSGGREDEKAGMIFPLIPILG